MVWQEAQIVKERVNGLIATETIALMSVMAVANGGGQDAHNSLMKMIKGLQDGR